MQSLTFYMELDLSDHVAQANIVGIIRELLKR